MTQTINIFIKYSIFPLSENNTLTLVGVIFLVVRRVEFLRAVLLTWVQLGKLSPLLASSQ